MLDKLVYQRELHPVTEQIQIKKNQNGSWGIYAGNTGMLISQSVTEVGRAKIHFVPDEKMGATTEVEKIKHGLMFALGLSALTNWYKEGQMIEDSVQKPKFLYWTTNKQMHEFTLKLLGKNIYEPKGRFGNLYDGEINMDKLVNNEDKVQRISKLAEACKRFGYMTKFVP